MIRKPQQQIEDMEQARVRPGWNSRRPAEVIETETEDEKRRTNNAIFSKTARRPRH